MNRRAFLKTSAAFGAALSLPRWGKTPVRLASMLPLPIPHTLVANPDAEFDPAAWDAVLVPAYRTIDWIQQQRLSPVYGPPGRAHDPEGIYTWPATARREHRWQWNWPRLTLGLWLQQSGHSVNDFHPGHLARLPWPSLETGKVAGAWVEYDWVTAHPGMGLSRLGTSRWPAATPPTALPLLPWPRPYQTLAQERWAALTAARATGRLFTAGL